MKESSPRSFALFYSVFLVLGVILLGMGLWNVARSLRCKSWPTTTGVISSAKMGSHDTEHGGTTYSADISYDYQVGKYWYTSTRVSFGDISASAGYAQKILDRFPVGTKVPVYYSPSDPELAVLETGLHAGLLVFFGVGTIFTLAGGMMMHLARKVQIASLTPQLQPTTTSAANRNRPPLMMAVIFLFMGSMVCVMGAVEGNRNWIGYAVSGVFVIAGLLLLAMSLRSQIFQNILKWLFVVTFMGLFHWIAFVELGGRMMLPFALFCILFDVVVLASIIYRLVRGRDQLF